MIRLTKIDRTMRPREIAPGVSLTMRPATSIDIDQAQGEAGREIATLFTAPQAFKDFGFSDLRTGVYRDPETLMGMSSYLTAALLMEQIVEGWEGVAAAARPRLDRPVPAASRHEAGLRAGSLFGRAAGAR